ncbi:MAG: TetR/AcrR family transcriptional regulator C-terminal domain-containing protein [Staphylococcus rostri]|uniref:TetR/AcrR family transcriptional regulator n=1 Tax=Staphylococcus rostri TaxID=522262 RepID=UPI0026E01B53|nr:TetR/AcrR family transcriptional regulator C-terminal domain-containing protein [Staphylococcus rostri]MDO5375094.1 TetR/AcrR family transcriptional regulator C-terminal domain-containing protein [Staphylococcus rostri]
MTKTKAYYEICKALIRLLEHDDFEAITIKEICAESGVHRSTFYAHFEDKYQLLEVIKQYHMKRYKRIMASTTYTLENSTLKETKARILKSFRLLFRYILRYESFFKTILVTNPQPDIVRDYMSYTQQTYTAMLQALPEMQHSGYFIYYTIGGELAIVYKWLSTNCQESPEEMAEILYHNLIKINR